MQILGRSEYPLASKQGGGVASFPATRSSRLAISAAAIQLEDRKARTDARFEDDGYKRVNGKRLNFDATRPSNLQLRS